MEMKHKILTGNIVSEYLIAYIHVNLFHILLWKLSQMEHSCQKWERSVLPLAEYV